MRANQTPTASPNLWSRFHADYRPLFLVFLAIALLHLPLHSSLWLDEGITAWITSGSLPDAIRRSTEFQGQSPLFFILEWFAVVFFGHTETVLRAMPVAAFCGSLGMFLVLARRWCAPGMLWIAGMIFVSMNAMQVAAISARPYSLALFFSLVSVWALLRWEEKGRYRDSIVYLFSTLLSVYFQYLFAFMVVVHIVHYALHVRRQKIRVVSFFFEILLLAALLVPAGLHMQDLAHRGAAIAFLEMPSFKQLFEALLPPVVLIGIVSGTAFALIYAGKRSLKFSEDKRSLWWIAFWFLAPPISFFAASLLGPQSIFLSRYFLFYVPALAIAYAALPSLWIDPTARRWAVTGLAVVLLLREIDRSWAVEDWRGAVNAISSRDTAVPVLINSGLAEEKQIAWLSDASKYSYLTAPLQYYGLKNRGIILPPGVVGPDAKAYLDAVAKDIGGAKSAFFVTLEQEMNGQSTSRALLAYLNANGFASQEIGLAKGSRVRLFELSRLQIPAHDDPAAARGPAETVVLHDTPAPVPSDI